MTAFLVPIEHLDNELYLFPFPRFFRPHLVYFIYLYVRCALDDFLSPTRVFSGTITFYRLCDVKYFYN